MPNEKVDMKHLNSLKKKERKAFESWRKAIDEYQNALNTGHTDVYGFAFNNFCDWCGRIEPECGYLPIFAHGPNSHSGLICFDCDEEFREKQKNKKLGG